MNCVMDKVTTTDTLIHPSRDVGSVRLADGSLAHLYAIGRNDRADEALRQLFFTLSDTTRYMYYCAGVPSNETWAERFVELGHADSDLSFVLGAEVNDQLVGFARFGQNPGADPQRADIGVILTDAWQGRGLGGHMLCQLASEARQRGITTFNADILWENRRMLRLARRLFPTMRIDCSLGSCSLTIDL